MGNTFLKYSDTQNSSMRVKKVSFLLTSLSGLFHFCQFGIRNTETHFGKIRLFCFMKIVLNNGLETVLNPLILTAEMVSHLSRNGGTTEFYL